MGDRIVSASLEEGARGGTSGSPAIRTCAGCGQKGAQRDLLRFAAPEGVLVPDPERRRTGRGVYTHPRLSCFERAAARRAFARTLRRTVTVPDDLVEMFRRG